MRKAGIMLSEIQHGNLPVLFKACGYDFFIIDCEHGGFDYQSVSQILMTAKLCGIKAYVRLPDNNRKDIIKFMDMGALGLLLPMTDTPEDIERVVRYAKYSPLGKRGISTCRAHTLYNPPGLSDYMRSANEQTEIYAQIETEKGVNNLADIASVTGIAGLFFGPNDFTCDLGLMDAPTDKAVLNAITALCRTCADFDIQSGIITANDILINHAKKEKANLFCVGSEVSLLKKAASEFADAIRE